MSPDLEHGERKHYLRGCRCERCRRANADWCKRYRHRAHKAGGALRVDVTAARKHLEEMRHHYTMSSLAALADLSSSTIRNILAQRQSTIAKHVEQRILAIRPGGEVGGHWVPTTPAARRVQALCALGYSLHWQSHQINHQRANLYRLANELKPYITSAVDQRVRDLYDRHHMTPATSSDPIMRGAITKAKAMAARNGWAPPLAWDDIDDPDARPAGIRPNAA